MSMSRSLHGRDESSLIRYFLERLLIGSTAIRRTAVSRCFR